MNVNTANLPIEGPDAELVQTATLRDTIRFDTVIEPLALGDEYTSDDADDMVKVRMECLQILTACIRKTYSRIDTTVVNDVQAQLLMQAAMLTSTYNLIAGESAVDAIQETATETFDEHRNYFAEMCSYIEFSLDGVTDLVLNDYDKWLPSEIVKAASAITKI